VQYPFLGEGWGNADCLKSKAELPINGGLAFLLEEGGDNCRYVRKFVLINLGSSALLQPN
jgi:hypothetical protein